MLDLDSFAVDYTDLDLLSPIRKYAFVFVCQAGRLEMQSLLLAASLKRFLCCDHELIAAVPLPVSAMGAPSAESLQVLHDLGVRIVYIQNKFCSSEGTPDIADLYANKILCLAVPTDADKLIFLDSDVMFFREFHEAKRYRLPFNAKLVGMAGVPTTINKWGELYRLVDLPLPLVRYRVIGNEEGYPRQAFVPPYFNSGFVAIHGRFAPELSRVWGEYYLRVRDSKLLDVPFLAEQVSLSLALSGVGLVFDVMTVTDFSSYHYHRLENLQSNSELLAVAYQLIRSNAGLRRVLRRDSDWRSLTN